MKCSKLFLIIILLALILGCSDQESGPTKVILFRHGETNWNLTDILQGQADVPMNTPGKEQIKLALPELKKLNIEVIYSSPLKRAYESAEIVADSLDIKEIKKENDLMEMGIGIFTGLKKSELTGKEENLAVFKEWLKDTSFSVPSGPPKVITEETKSFLKDKEFVGESLSDIQNRCWNALNKIVENNKGKVILISCHGGVMQTILSKVENEPVSKYSQFKIKNASFEILNFNTDDEIIWENKNK